MNFKIEPKREGYNFNFSESEKEGIKYIKMTLDLETEQSPEDFTLIWNMNARQPYSVWSPLLGGARHLGAYWTEWREAESRLSYGMPITSVISKNGMNSITISVSDAFTPIALKTSMAEEDGTVICRVRFFTKRCAPIKHYEAIIRIDEREIFYCDAIREVAKWWETECGYTPAAVPDAAFDVVDSLWYSFHQELKTEDILKECALSAKLGMKTVIIDDGWQTDNNEGGYAYCGDWELCEKKIPDMKYLVSEIHKLGMKVMLWFSVPFVGKYSKRFEELKDILLDSDKIHHDTFTFDPRYPKTRDYLCDIYTRAMREWNLDGLKLDFIDEFLMTEYALRPDDRRDINDLEKAVDALMMRVHDEIIAINPDALIEFRQGYIGPAIRKYGNMLRVRDCPGDAMMNRRASVDMRLTSGNTAVHSDMIMWDYTDTLESAALEMYATFYAVPQISVRINEITDEHKKMLEYLIGVERKYSDVLLHGEFKAYCPEMCYTLIIASKGETEFITAYASSVINVTKSECIIANCTERDCIYVDMPSEGKVKVTDCMGNVLSEEKLSDGLNKISAPLASLCFIEK